MVFRLIPLLSHLTSAYKSFFFFFLAWLNELFTWLAECLADLLASLRTVWPSVGLTDWLTDWMIDRPSYHRTILLIKKNIRNISVTSQERNKRSICYTYEFTFTFVLTQVWWPFPKVSLGPSVLHHLDYNWSDHCLHIYSSCYSIVICQHCADF